MGFVGSLVAQALSLLATLFVFAVGLFVLAVVVMFIIDISQREDAIRRNYPVIGRFRHLFSTLGEFFRQYFFAQDREEMPFNRAQREWAYRSAAGVDNTVAFGSTQNITAVGSPIYANGIYPPLDEEASDPPALIIGESARSPYEAASLINISAMSYGSLSAPAVRALSKGAKLAGCWLNTGEGGLSDHHLSGGCDIIFQIGTAKYGVRDDDGNFSEDKLAEIAALPQVKMVEIKLSQGAKPGKGGILPADKVTEEIARIRGIPEGHASLSPNRHAEVASSAELLDFIGRVREVSGLPTGFKTAMGGVEWLEDLCALIIKRGRASAPDFITIDSGDGGTGAAPMPLIDNTALSVREALPMVVDVLERHKLKDRIRVICAGKLITPAEVAWAYCAGADFVNSARGFMFALGCIQSLKCNRNTCPTGITTHQRHLQRGLDAEDKAVRVKNYAAKIHYGVGLIAHACGMPHARALERHHVRLIQADGKSRPLSEIYPRVGQDQTN
ncbi:MAG: FMN-binding glutamate synthase family protein [Anderseniella sp.]